MGELVSLFELLYRKAKSIIFGKPCGSGVSFFHIWVEILIKYNR